MPVEINPRRLHGPWNGGFALDVHTRSSAFLGYDQLGHPAFDTMRSPIGQLLYQLKYRNDRAAITPLVDATESFIGRMWNPPVDAIVPVPPSRQRSRQPVMLVATDLSNRLGVPLCSSCITKVKRTEQLKDLIEYAKRTEALKDAFRVAPEQTVGRNLLLFDDLYGSGATVTAITELLKGAGKAKAVYLLTLTTKSAS